MSLIKLLVQRWELEPWHTLLENFNLLCRTSGPKPSVDAFFRSLKNLPRIEEVGSGRDFRGACFGGGIELKLSQCDFSYCPSLGHFYDCDVSDCIFDFADISQMTVGNILSGSTFRRTMAKGCAFMNARANNCIFDEATLAGSRFDNSNLTLSSFRRAKCRRVCFFGANLIGCDFQGANLEEAVFQNCLIDGTTDFRGASLINSYRDTTYDHQGALVGRGVDLSKARIDESTLLQPDESRLVTGIITSAIKVIRLTSSDSLAHKVKGMLVALKKARPLHLDTWQEKIRKQLSASELPFFDQVLDEAYRRLV